MATGRVTAAAARSSTASGRLTEARTFATAAAVGRVTAASVTSTSAARGRVSAAGAVSTVGPSVTVAPFLGNLEPGVPVAVTPLVAGFTPTATVWSCDRPGLPFTQVAGVLRYKPPALLAGGTVQWTVTVSRAGGADLTATATHTVLPHAGGWMASAAGALYPVLVGSPPI